MMIKFINIVISILSMGRVTNINLLFPKRNTKDSNTLRLRGADCRIQQNKKMADYRNVGITSNIIEYNSPSFTWNTDEKKILSYKESFEVVDMVYRPKPGNVFSCSKTYKELSNELINEINGSYGIVIINSHETIGNNSDVNYRFVIVE